MPAVILVALGLALMTGAEAHTSTMLMLAQSVLGLSAFALGLRKTAK